MKLIPGLPRLERKQGKNQCAVLGCVRTWYDHVYTWPVCWPHYVAHLRAEGMERLARQTHTAKLLAAPSGLPSERPVVTDDPGRASGLLSPPGAPSKNPRRRPFCPFQAGPVKAAGRAIYGARRYSASMGPARLWLHRAGASGYLLSVRGLSTRRAFCPFRAARPALWESGA